MNHEIRDILVGAATLLVLVLFGALSFQGKQLAPTGKYAVAASFTQVDGLLEMIIGQARANQQKRAAATK